MQRVQAAGDTRVAQHGTDRIGGNRIAVPLVAVDELL
jgi:hypothetical protein